MSVNGLHALPNEWASFPYIPVCFHRIEVFSSFQNIWSSRRILYSLKFAALFDFLNLSFVCFFLVFLFTQQFFECRLSWLKPFRFYWLCRRVLSEYEDIRNLHALIISQLRGVLCPEHNQSIPINQYQSIWMWRNIWGNCGSKRQQNTLGESLKTERETKRIYVKIRKNWSRFRGERNWNCKKQMAIFLLRNFLFFALQ